MPTQIQQSERLHAEVRALIEACASSHAAPPSDAPAWSPTAGASDASVPPEGSSHLTAELERIGLAIARYQATFVPPLARLHESLGTGGATLRSLDEVPSLSSDVFRLRRIAAHPVESDSRLFRTSGTSRGEAARGAHPFRDVRTMELAALVWARHMLWPDGPPARLVVLCPRESEAPDSSLSFMLARFSDHLAAGSASWHFDGHSLDVAGIVDACRLARERQEPTLVAGTAFAFAELLERSSARMALAPRSRLMPTGGYKGRKRSVDEAELTRRLAERFEVDPSHVVGEYGMTELSSQLYEGTLVRALGRGLPTAEPGRYYPPPWVRVDAVDAVHHQRLPAGEVGLCRIVDLANVDSSLAVLTADRVRREADGSVTLLGRASGAPARGCSLGIEEALDGADP